MYLKLLQTQKKSVSEITLCAIKVFLKSLLAQTGKWGNWTVRPTKLLSTRNRRRWERYTKENLFEILWNESEIRSCVPFSDWFGTKRTFLWLQINRKMVNTISFRVDLIRFKKYFSVCTAPVNGCFPTRDMQTPLPPQMWPSSEMLIKDAQCS